MLLITTIMLCSLSPSVYAQSADVGDERSPAPGQAEYAPIVISEISPGTDQSASQEFIELYNQSTTSIDLSKDEWQVQIASSTATDWSRSKSTKLAGTFYPGTYMLLSGGYVASGQATPYLDTYASGHFPSGMTGASGHVRLINKASLATDQPAISAVEWSVQNDDHTAVSPAISQFSSLNLDASIIAGSSIKRKLDATHHFVQTLSQTNQSDQGDRESQGALLVSTCPSPTANNLQEHQIAATTGPIATSMDIDNQACSEQDEDKASEVLLPDGSAGADVQNEGLLAPFITELLPNPVSPDTDSEDEYIELYNPNHGAYDLSSYVVEVIGTTTKRYTIPEGTSMPGQTYIAFRSLDTHISLPNTTATVRLCSPDGRILAQADVYADAKEGHAWALIDGVWQWTLEPTLAAANISRALVATTAVKTSTTGVKAKTTVTKTTTSKTKKATASSTKAKAVKAPKADVAKAQPIAATTTMSPVHPVVLAVVGAFALLYGAYEYRGDVANKIHKFRANRANRRANR